MRTTSKSAHRVGAAPKVNAGAAADVEAPPAEAAGPEAAAAPKVKGALRRKSNEGETQGHKERLSQPPPCSVLSVVSRRVELCASSPGMAAGR